MTQPKLSTWTSQDDYDSDFTAVTAASRTSPERSNDIGISRLKENVCRRRGVSNSDAVRGALPGGLGGTHTPVAPGNREREGEESWERWKPRKERGVGEGRREGDAIFRRSQRYGYSAFRSIERVKYLVSLVARTILGA